MTGGRFSFTERWPGVLAQELGDGYRVIEEGLNGRTTVWDDPIQDYRNGKTYLMPCLWSHRPIDLVTIMLGTNDLKTRFALTACEIAAGAGALVELAQRSGAGASGNAPEVLLMSPPLVGELGPYDEMYADAGARSRKFGECYRRTADKYGCHFLDTAQIVAPSALDGVHLEEDQHRKLGLAVAAFIREIFETG